ncbi:hypothetical protein OROGR_018981 [Orobanche gracilis]
MSSSASILTPTQKYAAGALFALALHRAQIHQTSPLGSPFRQGEDGDGYDGDRSEGCVSSSSSGDAVSDDPQLWVHPSSGLLRPVFKFLEIDSRAWDGLEETVAYAPAKNHVGAVFFLRLLAEDISDTSEACDMELALANSIEAMSLSMEENPADYESKQEKQRKYEHACREKFSTPDKIVDSKSKEKYMPNDRQQEINAITSIVEEVHVAPICDSEGKPLEEVKMLSYPRKAIVLYELLSACLANAPEDPKKPIRRRKGYDARHRVALRLLATWFDVKWTKMESVETMVAFSAMALLKEEESKEAAQSSKSSWDKWKRGGIIGAAALTGGTLMAVTGGLAAPAIAAGFGALAPTLGTIIPVIGAGGFAAFASAAGSIAGSVAVAASFGAAGAGLTGSKVARRIGDVDEFEFKAIGENHNQGRLGVEISVSGFVFEEDDFIKPWEGQNDNLERYVLQWESKNLIAVSTAIQDWLTSRIAMEMMKQGAMMTVLSTLLTALAWPATLLVLTDFIDSKWTVAVNRPVTLSETNAGLVERVVLLGAPIAIQDVNWEATRKVVAGRYVNAYSTNDWMLGVAFRANLLTQGLAGIQPVDVPGIENVGTAYILPSPDPALSGIYWVDVTEVIEGHSSYLWRTQQILEQLELDTYYPVFNRRVVKS